MNQLAQRDDGTNAARGSEREEEASVERTTPRLREWLELDALSVDNPAVIRRTHAIGSKLTTRRNPIADQTASQMGRLP